MSAIIPGGGSGQNWRGEYNPATTYYANDAVSYNGSSFICTGTTVGVAPVPDTVSWMIPPLATTGSMGSIAALRASSQTSYYARGDNTWQLLPAGAIVGTTETQDLSNKTLIDPIAKVSATAIASRVPGMILSQPNYRNTSTAGVYIDIWRIVIPANMMSRIGDVFHINAEVGYATNANLKHVAFGLGTVTVINSTTASNFYYQYNVDVCRMTATQARVNAVCTSWNGSTGGSQSFRNQGTIDFGVNQDLIFSANGPTIGDVASFGSFVMWWPAMTVV